MNEYHVGEEIYINFIGPETNYKVIPMKVKIEAIDGTNIYIKVNGYTYRTSTDCVARSFDECIQLYQDHKSFGEGD